MTKRTEVPQLCPVTAVDALLETGTAVISAASSLDERLSRQTLPAYRNVVSSQRIAVLFGTSSSGHTLLNAWRIAADGFDAN